MTIPVQTFVSQNWVITPAARAVTDPAPTSIIDQDWLVVVTGVTIVNLQGINLHDWRRETLTMPHNALLDAPVAFVLANYPINPQRPGEFFVGLNVEQSAPFAATSSILDMDTGGVDAGFAVDAWRLTPFAPTSDENGNPVNQIFRGIDVDVAVRNNHATLHRISYHVTLLGKLTFLAGPL